MSFPRWILKQLLRASPHPLQAEILHGAASGAITPRPTLGEVREALAKLEERGLVHSVRDTVDDDVIRYGLTVTGQMEARQ